MLGGSDDCFYLEEEVDDSFVPPKWLMEIDVEQWKNKYTVTLLADLWWMGWRTKEMSHVHVL